MKLNISFFYCVAAVVFFCDATCSFAKQAQMEIRESEQFDPIAFAESKPAVGEMAPDLQLQTLDGKTVSLSSFRGKNIVVVKAGYT